ncbi:MAG: DUF411 domain-containing protein [Hyphomicrobiaceae bacterium]|nr:DUF411 domain-containing protein [Hyphomicrobiaceae bacterium]
MISIGKTMSRRATLGLIALATNAGFLSPARSQRRLLVVVHKDPNCGCCTAWARHLERAGFGVTMVETPAVEAVKRRLGVPGNLASCHTAELEGYVLEGHVPLHAIERLLVERPEAKGLAVPGMPSGSPGMEGGTSEAYEVFLFGPGWQHSFGRYRGTEPI